MTLPSSGPMSASMINVELGRASNAPFDINGAAERALAGVPSGPISFSNFYGKSNIPPLVPVAFPSYYYKEENPPTGTGTRYSLPIPVNTPADLMLMFVWATMDAVQAGSPAPVGWTLVSEVYDSNYAFFRVFTRVGNGAATADMGVMSGGTTKTYTFVIPGAAGALVSCPTPTLGTSAAVSLPRAGTIIPMGVRQGFFNSTPGSGWTYPYPNWNYFEGDNEYNVRMCYAQVAAGAYTPALYGEDPRDMTYVRVFQFNVIVYPSA